MIDIYEQLADLLEYPDEGWTARVKSARGIRDRSGSINDFVACVAALSHSNLQELYTRTFDLNPTCALEIGYHLFGENYKRGEFLANLRETEAPFDLGQENQLPDYLPVLLRLLTKLEDEELRESLVRECLIPAIEKMRTSFKDSDNPYKFLLKGVSATLQSELGVVSVEGSRLNTRASLPVLDLSVATRPELF